MTLRNHFGWPLMVLSLLLPAHGLATEVHALILAIGSYPPPYRLEGVSQDVVTARAIAKRMGVSDANLRVLRDQELTLDGMRRAIDDLVTHVQEGDQVFIYYSGHGGRQLVMEDGRARCAESLIAADGYGFLDAELEQRLKQLSTKALKIVMFIDACHSGGTVTRSLSKRGNLYKPKHWNGKGVDAESCAKPSNLLTRGIALAAKSAGSGGNNFAYIAAARDDEVSFDQPRKGGVASQAWRACLAGEARDLDGSGALSVEEIRACAQARIDAELGNVDGLRPHHVTVVGNPALILRYEQPAPPAATNSVPPPKPTPRATLDDIYNNRDDRRLVTLQTERPTVAIGRDTVQFSLTSREAGYVYLLMVGSDGETFDLLFPNQVDRANLIQAGETLRLPRADWQLAVQGPPGKDTLLAIVSETPRDFSKLGLKPAGPFSMVEAVAAKDIQLVTAISANAGSAECADAQASRTLAVRKKCSNAYGAALLHIEEIAAGASR